MDYTRRGVLAGAKLLVSFGILPLLRATPLDYGYHAAEDQETPKPASDPTLWIYLAVAVVLVLLGGVFAGLTIALMGQVRSRPTLQAIALRNSNGSH